ncbi:hypothetical protein N7463_000377 [Penicillium fimorum]|uniref:Uncharacterized protein n=1 Tax=Penicillium fimorum TaxID=1882269 RepID=A0A9W9Y451_9EURO|nr:hypothetical protein N7463_000377 [Penicillium fimorum]
MSLDSFSRGKADLGRSAANIKNFTGRSGDSADDRYRSALDDPKKGRRLLSLYDGARRSPVDRSGPK